MSKWSSGSIFARTEQVVKPEGHKYCRFCKCYVPNDTPSWQQHTQGSGHIKSKGQYLKDLKWTNDTHKREDKFREDSLRSMEEAALEEYKEKDIGENRDFTARLYNNESLPGIEKDTYVEKEPRAKKRKQEGGREEEEVEPSWAEKYMARMAERGRAGGGLRPVAAPKGGTKYHKTVEEDRSKVWWEARNEDGTRYYIHSQTKESRWQPPPGGFLSIKEQRELLGEEEDSGEEEEKEAPVDATPVVARKKEKSAKPPKPLKAEDLVPLPDHVEKEEEARKVAEAKINFRTRGGGEEEVVTISGAPELRDPMELLREAIEAERVPEEPTGAIMAPSMSTSPGPDPDPAAATRSQDPDPPTSPDPAPPLATPALPAIHPSNRFKVPESQQPAIQPPDFVPVAVTRRNKPAPAPLDPNTPLILCDDSVDDLD